MKQPAENQAALIISETFISKEEFHAEIEKQRRDIDYGLWLLKEAKQRTNEQKNAPAVTK